MLTDTLKTWEKILEKELLEFLVLLGAGEAPEAWQTARVTDNGNSESPPPRPRSL